MSVDVSTIRYAMIGCGMIAPIHFEAFQRIPGVEPVYACDLMEERARRCAENYRVPRVTTDYREVLKDPSVDCVSICTYPGTHAEIAIAAIEAGKHVLCEKALATRTADLDRMIAAQEERPHLVFAPVFPYRFSPIYRSVKRWVEEGIFGTILTGAVHLRCLRLPEYYRSADWRGTWLGEGGGVLMNQAIDFIDLLGWLLGGVQSVCGYHANLTHGDEIETEDTACAVLRFRNRAVGTVDATTSSHRGWESVLSIHGDRGLIEIRNERPTKISFRDPSVMERVEKELRGWEEKAAGCEERETTSGYLAQIADFIQAIRERRPPFISVHQGRHAVDIVLGIYRSHWIGGWVEIP